MLSVVVESETPQPGRVKMKKRTTKHMDRFSVALAKTKKRLFRSRKNRSKDMARRKSVLHFLESKWVVLLMLIPVAYLLFIDDFVTASACAQTSALVNGIGVTKVLIFFLFIAELGLMIFARRREYYFSVMFILDLISIASLIPDVVGYVFSVSSLTSIHSLSITRAARAARVVTRLARLPRLLELMEFRKKKQRVEVNTTVEPSKTGARLVARIAIKVIVIVLLLLLCVTLLTPGTDVTPYAVAGLRDLEVLESAVGFNSSVFLRVLNSYTTQFNPILFLVVNGNTLVNQQSLLLRTQPVYSNTYSTPSSTVTLVDPTQQYQAGLSLVETTCVIIILAGGTLFMTRDALVLVIRPLEKMLGLMKAMTAAVSAKGQSSAVNTDDMDDDDDDESDDETHDHQAESTTVTSVDYESGLESSSYEDEADELVNMVDLLAQSRMESVEQAKKADAMERAVKVLQTALRSYFACSQFTVIKKQIARRNQIFQEMLATERSYVASLAILINDFDKPLRSVLSPEQSRQIFSTVQLVLEYNQNFLVKLESTAAQWHPNAVVGDVFQSLGNMADVYSEFINNYNNAVEFVKKCLQNPDIAPKLKALAENPAVHGLDLSSYLIMPIQRSPRYVMLVEQMLKYTPEDHRDHPLLTSAFEVVKRVAAEINERKRDSENQLKVQDFYMRMEPPVPLLMNPGCLFLHEGILIEEGQEFFGLLFSNVFLKCEVKQNRIVVKATIPTNILKSACKLANSSHFGLYHAFQIETSTEQHLLSCSSSTARQDWFAKFDEMVTAHTVKRKSVWKKLASASSGNSSPRMSML